MEFNILTILIGSSGNFYIFFVFPRRRRRVEEKDLLLLPFSIGGTESRLLSCEGRSVERLRQPSWPALRLASPQERTDPRPLVFTDRSGDEGS